MHGVDVEMNMSDLDLNLVRGLVMVLLVVGFVGMWAWAWSSKRKTTFRDASLLPLQEDHIAADGVVDGKNGAEE